MGPAVGVTAMSSEPDDAIGAALSRLRNSLGPLVDEAVAEAERSGRLVKGDALRAAGLASDSGVRLRELPLDQLLRVMFLTWNAAFAMRLSAAHRNAASGLRATVDRLTAGAALSPSEIARAEERAALLLGATSTDESVVERRNDAARPAGSDSSVRQTARAVQVDQSTGPGPTGVEAAPKVRAGTSQAPEPAPAATPSTPTHRVRPVGSPRDFAAENERPARIVCWMKPDEARVVLDAYLAGASQEVTTEEGWIVGAEWNEPGSEEAQKYRAEVCMIRYGRSKERGTPKRLWIRREEAEAVLEAYRARASIPFEHRTHGSGGCAQFHPDDAEETKRYLANVMLKRYR